MTLAPNLDGSEPVVDGELIYRRIPVSQNWYIPSVDSKLLFQAFRPRTDDATGLSVVRGEPYNLPAEAAHGPSKSGYYVAVFRVGDLRAHGIEVVARPMAGVKGHAEITDLTTANRDTDEAMRIMELLAEQLCLRVEGPFHVHQA